MERPPRGTPGSSSFSRRTALAQLAAGGFGLALAVRSRETLAQEASPTAATMPPIVQAWADAWSAGDSEGLLALYTDDAVFEEVAFGEVAEGTDAIRALIEREAEVFTDVEVTLTSGFGAGS